MGSVVTIIGLLIAVVGAVAGVGVWKAERKSSEVAAIERERWHADLTPDFDAACTTDANRRGKLTLTFRGPPGLDRLDRLDVYVRDDNPERRPVGAGGPTAEEIASHVWGPYRFTYGVDGATKSGRSAMAGGLSRGDSRQFSLERTSRPAWSDDDRWWEQYADHPLRLTVECTRQGHQSWAVPLDVNVQFDGPPRVRWLTP